ncbi:MAG: SRPBCC domain-containing protein [Verrucomicrobia bacterium]|nr:SRPBCC domain-containing protein [Verrucomicrobiota bacterium]
MAADSAADREIVSARRLPAPRREVYAAFADPRRLASWWGPRGFTSEIRAFELRPGGRWRLTLRDGAGTRFKNESEFLVVRPAEEVVLRHLDPVHDFVMAMIFTDEPGGTRLTWRLTFASAAECGRCRDVIVAANEQNFDRLAQHLATFNPNPRHVPEN